jgi:hypothetical protein
MPLGTNPKDIYLTILNGLMVAIHLNKDGKAVSPLSEESILGSEMLDNFVIPEVTSRPLREIQ